MKHTPRQCLKCHVTHTGKYQVCSLCIEGINTEWKQKALASLKQLQEIKS